MTDPVTRLRQNARRRHPGSPKSEPGCRRRTSCWFFPIPRYGAGTATGTSSLSLPATRRTQLRMTWGSVGLVSRETAT